ncbi:hypothetical protein GQ54DRAFT_295950 [Martensiomyces pterosporus]|nr:hypothetical protein GQ54DRAFT_295950 [Martensiomyces pterosporus]
MFATFDLPFVSTGAFNAIQRKPPAACVLTVAILEALFRSFFNLSAIVFSAFIFATQQCDLSTPHYTSAADNNSSKEAAIESSSSDAGNTAIKDNAGPELSAASVRTLIALAGIRHRSIRSKRAEFFCWTETTFSSHLNIACLYVACLSAINNNNSNSTSTSSASEQTDITQAAIRMLHSMHDSTYEQVCALREDCVKRGVSDDIRALKFKHIFSKLQCPEAFRSYFCDGS